jgi:hypothetical protein
VDTKVQDGDMMVDGGDHVNLRQGELVNDTSGWGLGTALHRQMNSPSLFQSAYTASAYPTNLDWVVESSTSPH